MSLGAGLSKVKGKVFRIGHLGHFNELMPKNGRPRCRLLLVAEQDGPEMFARIGMMQALQRHQPKPTSAPRRKRAKQFRLVR
jgi:hypothetical protein